jgi:hypothetical protein
MVLRHPIFQRIACAAMGVALFLVTGGHLAVLQGIAWTTMVHDFSRTGSLTKAVDQTFDGRHLCPLCKKIATARAAEEKAPLTLKVDKKAEVFVTQASAELPKPICRPQIYGPAPCVAMPERSDAPPVPVPRRLLS